jgi:hypothetical protein
MVLQINMPFNQSFIDYLKDQDVTIKGEAASKKAPEGDKVEFEVIKAMEVDEEDLPSKYRIVLIK